MKSWKHPPKNSDVSKYVECYWFLEKEPGDVGNNYPKLNPHPSAHLIISDANQMFQFDQESNSQTGSGSHWIFPHRKTFTMDHSSPFQVIGIKFKVGALYSLKTQFSSAKPDKIQLDKIEYIDINQLIDLNSLGCEKLFSQATNQAEQVGNELDELLAPWLSEHLEDKYSELVRHILPLLGNTPIAQIGATLHRSQRTIERGFQRVTGLTLKQCHSMMRLEDVITYLHKIPDKDIDWSDLAAKFEFSDQPHFIRHLKHSIGNTPREYLRQRDLTIDIYGDFEFK